MFTCSDAMPLDCHAEDTAGAKIYGPKNTARITQLMRVFNMVTAIVTWMNRMVHYEKLAIAEVSFS